MQQNSQSDYKINSLEEKVAKLEQETKDLFVEMQQTKGFVNGVLFSQQRSQVPVDMGASMGSINHEQQNGKLIISLQESFTKMQGEMNAQKFLIDKLESEVATIHEQNSPQNRDQFQDLQRIINDKLVSNNQLDMVVKMLKVDILNEVHLVQSKYEDELNKKFQELKEESLLKAKDIQQQEKETSDSDQATEERQRGQRERNRGGAQQEDQNNAGKYISLHFVYRDEKQKNKNFKFFVEPGLTVEQLRTQVNTYGKIPFKNYFMYHQNQQLVKQKYMKDYNIEDQSQIVIVLNDVNKAKTQENKKASSNASQNMNVLKNTAAARAMIGQTPH